MTMRKYIGLALGLMVLWTGCMVDSQTAPEEGIAPMLVSTQTATPFATPARNAAGLTDMALPTENTPQVENGEAIPAPNCPGFCCMAFTASCLACSACLTIDEYCALNPTVMGCPEPEPEDCMSCEEALAAAGIPIPGSYTPQCEADGSYSPTQCNASSQTCWCVDECGVQIAGTSLYPTWSQGYPECEDFSGSCEVGDMTYADGESWEVDCNTCFCDGGSVACTEMYCGCGDNDDCPANEWCRPTCDDGGLGMPVNLGGINGECVPYVGEGANCGGFVMECYLELCEEDLSCISPCNSIADMPGTCMDNLCSDDGDCPSTQWCRSVEYCDSDPCFGTADSAYTQKECVPYALENETCGSGEPADCGTWGAVGSSGDIFVPWSENRCGDNLSCTDGIDGTCMAATPPEDCDEDYYYSTCEANQECMADYECVPQEGCVSSTCFCQECEEVMCQPSDCGPQLGMPSYTCTDGSIGGNTGNCIPSGDGCAWEVVDCDPCDGQDSCFINPCDTSSCPAYPTADCEQSYCGCVANYSVNGAPVDCDIAPTCNSYDPYAFGACDMVLGYGMVGDECTAISGCSSNGESFFSSLDACQNSCTPGFSCPPGVESVIICTADCLWDGSICMPIEGCDYDTDCAEDQWCRPNCEDDSSSCVPYAQEGEACSGEVLDCEVGVCDESLDCHFGEMDPTLSNDDPGECVCTDLNGDGAFNVIDIITLVQIALGTSDVSEAPCAPDYNGDNMINIQDIITIVMILLSL